MPNKFGIVIHGGAGTILKAKMSDEIESEIRATLKRSLQTGYDILEKSGGTALDAVQQAINVMEDSPLFNAGKGAVFTYDGDNEQDATIMDGSTGQAGGVGGVRQIKNPIDLARTVMEKSPHVLLISTGAEQFARAHGFEMMEPEYFHTELRKKQLQAAFKKEKASGDDDPASITLSEDGKHGTVGAVALDQNGNLAAATSSGGMTNKKFGRVGDSAQVGAGTWADKICAVSTTGHGEYFMRGVVAYDVAVNMQYRSMSLAEATATTIREKLDNTSGEGGLIAIDSSGNFVLPYNTKGMYRGYQMSGSKAVVAIWQA